MLPTVDESRGYDFQDSENAEKWRGIFVNSLKKVLEQVHPSLTADNSALEYVESLCLRLLGALCAQPTPLTVQDIEERVARTFPTPLDRWTLKDARETFASKRKRFTFPVDKLHHLLTKEVLQYKIDQVVTYFIAAILEYVSADIFKFAGNFFKKISHKAGVEVLTKSDVNTAMWADKVLVDMFFSEGDVAADPPPAHLTPAGSERHRRGSLTYGELVRELVTDERQFLRELNLIIRVFREEFEKILPHDTQLIELIFGNIMDIYELTVTLLGNLEDAIEMAEDSPTPYVGSCFEELAEVEEFRAYVRYTNNVTQREARDALQNLVDDPAFAERLDTAGHGFRLACKYYLPKLLLLPVGHVLLYHQYVLALLHIATAPEDIESFKQVKCNLHPITTLLSKALGNGAKMDASLRMPSRSRRQLAVEKCSELSKIVDNWEPRDIPHCCNDFIREDTISKVGPGRRVTERRAFLFDGLLLLCKPATSVVPGGVGGAGSGGGPLLKLKEKLHIRKLDIHDKPDTDEHKHLVELAPRAGAPLLLAAASLADKRSWMCDLVMLNTKPMLDRTVDSILLDLEKRHPLRLPPLERYRFAAPDDASNLLLDPDHHHHPIIKGATLLKLVERVTYHVYADLGLVRTFLTTYRAFCEPRRLLLLLQERFHVPPPNHILENVEASTGTDAEKLSKNTAREDLKRYRKEFEQPVKFRVINVIRHWVDQHFYDFEREPELLAELQAFLQTVDDKRMRKWVHSVLNTIHRKSVQSGLEEGPAHVFDHAPPPLLGFLADPQRVGFHPLCWHPIELARQLTHIEFQLFRQVKPSELVGTVWTKKDKEKTSPNLLKIIKHTTNFTRWMGKWIVESRNLEERVGVVSALLEAGVALLALNNFNGVLAVAAAMDGAAVHRLTCTFQLVSPRLLRELEYFRSLTAEHFRRYRALLRSINPPCVPFFGQYLTNIIHIEEGNPDYLGDTELINISKHRQVAKITAEIQQYQNQPYCLTPEPRAKAFLESLDPCPGLADVEKYLFDMSLELEPRHLASRADLPKFPRKYPELSVKPPKVSRRHVYPHAANADDSTQLSPTSQAGDATSISSFSMYGQDDHRSSKSDSLFSLRDKFLDLRAPTRSSARDEPPSPRERHSPRHDRSGSTSTMSGHSSGARRGALSPRSAIVDADLFYGRTAQDRMPVLLPRNSMVSTCSLAIDHEATTPNSLSDVPPEPPDRMSLEQPPERPERMPDVPDRPPDVPDRVEKPDRLLEWAEKTPDRPEKTFDRPERMPDRPEKKIDRPERPEKTPDRPEKTLDRLEWPEKTPDRPEKTIDRPEKTFDRPERPEKTPDRPEKTLDRLERPEKTPDRPEKTFDRLERPEKTPDRPEKTFDRPERPVKTPDRSEKTLDRLERPEKTPDRPEKTLDRPERPEKTPDQPEKTLDRPERPEKTPDRPEKTLDRPERPEKTPDRPEKTLDRPERPEKTPNRPEKTLDRPERPEKTPDRPEKTLDRPERPEKTPDRPERPVPSPKIQDIYRMSSASPKRSPGASASPRPNDRGTLFRFPAPLPPPTLPPPPLPGGGVPPPLPPRRRAAGPHTPRSGGSRSPPPLPPRAAPALMLVNHSTLLQRRHHNNSTLAPRLPPKPPPAAVAPRT